MKNRAILIATMAFLAVADANASVIGVSPTTQTVALGDTVGVEIDISGLGTNAAPSISIFDLDLAFDPALLLYSSASFGDPVLGDQLDLFVGFSDAFATDLGGGVVNFYELSYDFPFDLEDFQADAFTMVTVNFDTLAAGTSALTLTLNTLGDAFGDPLDATLESGSVTVEPASVPEPVTSSLLAFGLLGLAIGRRRLLRR